MRRQRLRLQDGNGHGGKSNTDTPDDSRDEHLPVLEGGGLDGGADDDDHVRQDDGSFPSDLLAEDEGDDGA